MGLRKSCGLAFFHLFELHADVFERLGLLAASLSFLDALKSGLWGRSGHVRIADLGGVPEFDVAHVLSELELLFGGHLVEKP